MPDSTWDHLIVEQRTAPPVLDDARFRTWMANRHIFISSTMDPEMAPAREAVAAYLRGRGAVPVMWEAITPQDRHPEDAFLDGVTQSALFVLVVGSRYGKSDMTGYSPTHKEANRAKELELPRLLFERAVPGGDRDGRLNDWLGSLYAELSGARYVEPTDLVAQLDQRLREIAGGQESHWVKLGNLVFPASVRQRSRQGTTEFHVRATLRDTAVRRAVAALGHGGGVFAGRGGLQLTWGVSTYAVQIDAVESHSTTMSADDVEVVCRAAGQPTQSSFAMMGGVTIGGGSGRSFGPEDQAVMWANHALFGAPLPKRGQQDALLAGLVAPDGPTLPALLKAVGARGWLAEGLTRVYAVEGLAAKFGGHFEALEVGPATAMAVRVRGRYRLGSWTPTTVEIDGSVPLAPGARAGT